jgi:hypothetical protein
LERDDLLAEDRLRADAPRDDPLREAPPRDDDLLAEDRPPDELRELPLRDGELLLALVLRADDPLREDDFRADDPRALVLRADDPPPRDDVLRADDLRADDVLRAEEDVFFRALDPRDDPPDRLPPDLLAAPERAEPDRLPPDVLRPRDELPDRLLALPPDRARLRAVLPLRDDFDAVAMSVSCEEGVCVVVQDSRTLRAAQ